MKGWQEEQGLFGREAEDGAAFGDDDERLLVQEVWVDVADGRRRELQGEFAEATGKVVAWRETEKVNQILNSLSLSMQLRQRIHFKEYFKYYQMAEWLRHWQVMFQILHW